ncbi:MAG: TIM barrel protein [Spirochaetes bacterium]|uniref:TIM barrel protein n=1 Tax=Candidatus Ornithospirochaeta stercoravium TaxID=2840897 RepID=A0A9D9IC95_9SPIO|nr:TIM barrel protein [Candidatus Ornithospirochaeta stercoravium]
MKLGIISSILDGWTYEEMIDEISRIGYECVEVACWPQGKAERKYGGVSHIDVNNLDEEKKEHILSYAAEHGVTISALAYYPNTMDGNPDKRKASIEHLYKVIDAASFLGIDLVTTFIGRVTELPVEDNLEIFAEVWPPIIKYAASKGVRIGIENCPMLFDRTNWPGGQNLFTSPVLWRKMFEIIPDRNFGINFDPSHFVWQQMDYIAPIYEFKDRIFHVHFKDIKLYPEKLKECGVMAYPLDYMDPKIPGYGDVEWKRFVSALTDIRYDGFACVEVEDRAFEGSKEKIIDSLKQSYKYMRALVI